VSNACCTLTSAKKGILPISFAMLLSKWQTLGRIIIQGITFATFLRASFVFPGLSEDIPEKFFWLM
jgi:hypothetical protein